MRFVLHYLILFLIFIIGLNYWVQTTGDGLFRFMIDHKPYGDAEVTGVLAILLHPIASYGVLLMCLGLVAKEFFISDLKQRFLLNVLGFLVLCFFIGVISYWM